MTTNGHHHASSDASGYHVIPLQINGQYITTDTTFDVVSPVSNKVSWKASSVSKAQAINAVEAAQKAFPAWSITKPSKRRDILLKASDILASRADEFAEYMDVETGSVSAYSAGFNVPSSVEQLRDVAGRIVTVTGSIPVCAEEGKSALLYKEPYGVVFGIAPWSFPNLIPHGLPNKISGTHHIFSAFAPYRTQSQPEIHVSSKAPKSLLVVSGPLAPSSKKPVFPMAFSM